MDTKNVFLGILMVAIFATGFLIGRFSSVGDTVIAGGQNNPVGLSTESTDAGGVSGEEATAEGNTTISTANLTDGQKKMLTAVGIDAESITVTPEMAACADASLGANRMSEIIGGATPSFSEGVKLVACYK